MATSTETLSQHSYAFTVANHYHEALLKAIKDQQIQDIPQLREKGKELLKAALKSDNPKLYAFIMKGVLDICVKAYHLGQLFYIQSILELDADEMRYTCQLLDEKQIGSLYFWSITNSDLEKFAEDLDLNKNVLLPFKKAIYVELAGYNIFCIPPSMQRYAKKSPDEVFDPELFGFEFEAHLEYFYTHKKPKDCAKFIYQICQYLINSYQDPEFGKAFFVKLEVNKDEIFLSQFLLNPKQISLMIWYILNHSLGDFVRTHHIPWADMNAFKQAVIQELENNVIGKPLIPSLESLIERFSHSVANFPSPAADAAPSERGRGESAGTLLGEQDALIKRNFYELEMYFIHLFQQNDPKAMARLFLEFSKSLANMLKGPILNVLTSYFDLSQQKLEELSSLGQEPDLRFLALGFADSVHFSEYARNCNISNRETWVFKHELYQAIQASVPLRLVNTMTSTIAMLSTQREAKEDKKLSEDANQRKDIKSIEEDKQPTEFRISGLEAGAYDIRETSPATSAHPLKTVRSENLYRDLKVAYKLKNPKEYKAFIQKLVALAEHAYKNNQIREFVETFKIKLPFVTPLIQALESNNPKNVVKLFLDYTLKHLIAREESGFYSELFYWHKTVLKRQKVIQERRDACLNFQKALYQEFELDTTPENLGPLFTDQYKYDYNVLNLYGSVSKKDALVHHFPGSNSKESKKLFEELLKALRTKNYGDIHNALKDLKVLLKKSFSEKNEVEFAKIINNLLNCIQLAYQESQIEFISLILNTIAAPLYYYPSSEEIYPRIRANKFGLFLKSLDEKMPHLSTFIMLDIVDFREIADYNSTNYKTIASFKAQVFTEMTGRTQLFTQDEVKAYLEKLARPNLEDVPNLLFVVKLIDYHGKDLILRSQTAGKGPRNAHRELRKLIVAKVKFVQLVWKTLNATLAKTVLHSTIPDLEIQGERYGIASELMNRKDSALLYWLLINESELDSFVHENGIPGETVYRLKSNLYESLSENELLRSLEELRNDLNTMRITEIDSEHAVVDIRSELPPSKVRLIAFETELLIREAFQARDVRTFVESLEFMVSLVKDQVAYPEFLSTLLHLDGEKLKKLIGILKQGKMPLATRFVLDTLYLTEWNNDNNYANEDAIAFLNQVIQYFERRDKALLPTSAEVLLKTNLEQLHQFNANNPHIIPVTLEVYLMLKDAYLQKDSKKFAEIIHSIRKFMGQLYHEYNLQALIQLFELQSMQFEQRVYTMADKYEGLLEEVQTNALILEKVVPRLIANDQDGLAKLLIDFFMMECCRHPLDSATYTFLAYTNVNTLEFTQAIYKALKINPLDFFSPGCMDIDKDANLIVNTFRTMANDGLDLSKYDDTIVYLGKNRKVHDCLIPPVDSDSFQYKELYKKLQQIWIEHLVAHRFGIMDKRLEGSYNMAMPLELQQATSRFYMNEACHKTLANIRNTELKDLSQEVWDATVQKISADLRDIFLGEDNAKLLKKVHEKQLIATPVFLRSDASEHEAWGHLTGAIFFQYKGVHYCMLSDRSNVIDEEDIGISIYKIGKPDNIFEAARNLIRSEKTSLTVEEFKAIINPLNLEKVHHIKKKSQKSGNCGWSSAAKPLDYGVKFVDFLEALSHIIPDNTPVVDAFKAAEKLAHPLYKAFSNFDRLDILKLYFEACKSYKFDPSVSLLAQILVKSENREQRADIVKTILDKKLIQPEHREKALETLLKAAEWMILSATHLKKAFCLEIDGKLLGEHAKRVLDAYLAHKTEEDIVALIKAAVKAIQERHPGFFKDQKDHKDKKDTNDTKDQTVPEQNDSDQNEEQEHEQDQGRDLEQHDQGQTLPEEQPASAESNGSAQRLAEIRRKLEEAKARAEQKAKEREEQDKSARSEEEQAHRLRFALLFEQAQKDAQDMLQKLEKLKAVAEAAVLEKERRDKAANAVNTAKSV